MNNLREAAQMALDALEAHSDIGIKAAKQIEALRAAIAQEEINAALDRDDEIERLSDLIQKQDKKLAEYEALAQPEPEPVAWWHDMGDVVDLNVSGRGTPLYTAPPQRECAGTVHERREWQGLTEEEIQKILDCKRYGRVDIKKAEQILKDKNT